MSVGFSDIIRSTDYTEVQPQVLVGYCMSTGIVVTDDYSGLVGKGLGTTVQESSGFFTQIQYSRELGTNASVGGGFAAYKLSPTWITGVLDPSPTDPILGPTQSLPSISGGPPAVSLGPLPGVPTLSLSHTSSGRSITFKCPRFSDEDVLDYRRLNKQTVGGKLIVFRDPSWTARESFKLEIENLTKANIISIREFLLATAGQTITFLDHRAISWEVRISNLGDASIENVNGRYTFPLVLETIS